LALLALLALLAEGLDNHTIAGRLVISPDTARAHAVNVLAKRRVASRLRAALFAMQHGTGSLRRRLLRTPLEGL
jgi:DNA-binding NarL/FixJ family response regulator